MPGYFSALCFTRFKPMGSSSFPNRAVFFFFFFFSGGSKGKSASKPIQVIGSLVPCRCRNEVSIPLQLASGRLSHLHQNACFLYHIASSIIKPARAHWVCLTLWISLMSLFPHFSSDSSAFKNSSDYISPTQIVQDDHPILRLAD